MKCYTYVVLVLFFNAANSTFWYKDDFERVTSTYNSDLSQDYLRALSIFKRKLQLLGFYPIVLNDDGLEYVSVDPYLIDDDYDDEMYKLLKKIRKEKKSRKKLLKKKSKKSKKTGQPPVATTTVRPIPNIVYYWPSTITTIVHPVKGSSSFEHSLDTQVELSEKGGKKPYENDSSEENSSEADSSYFIKKDRSGKPAKINYETSFSFQRKLKFDDDDTQSGEVENQSSISSTSTTSTTTPYPLLTVFPDPEEVVIQEILNQQEIVNKISDEEAGNVTKTIPVEDVVDQATESSTVFVKDNSTAADAVPNVTVEIPRDVYEDNVKVDQNQANVQDTKGEGAENILGESVASESQNPDTISVDVTESEAQTTESPLSIPSGILQFFHETLPNNDEQHSSIGLPTNSEVVANFPVPSSQQANHSDEIEETSENNTNSDGHRETDTGHSNSTAELNSETTTNGPTNQSVDEYLVKPNSSADKVHADSEVTIPTAHITDDSEGYEYSIDPKISLPIAIVEDLESRSLIDDPVVAVIVEDINGKSGRRSDVPIEADDDEDTTDNLPYNLTDENVLEQSSTIENNSAEVTSTSTNPAEASTLDNMNHQFDGEIIPLIPIIIKQMKQGNVSPEEMDILKASFGQLWPIILEEASRDGDSSEEMNPMLSEVFNSVNRRIVKREATVGRPWRQPIYGRRIYFDDDYDYVPRRRYYGRRRRPIVDYY